MAQSIPSGVWTVLDGAAQYQAGGQNIEVYQNTGRDVDAVIVTVGTMPGQYQRVSMVPDLGDFRLRPAGGFWGGWQGSTLSGSWIEPS